MNAATDFYLTLRQSASHSEKISGSKFLAVAYPVADKVESLVHLDALRKTYFDATHVCFAYRVIGAEHEDQLSLGLGNAPATGVIEKFSDDGEPSGTAGKPVLNAIKSRGLCNVLVAVVRYFGGTKLGIGGLVRAYGDAAAMAIDKAGTTEVFLTTQIELRFDARLTGAVMYALKKFSTRIVSQGFELQGSGHDRQTLSLCVRLGEQDRLRTALNEATNAQVSITPEP
ncbi:MAG: YigZ family protein [Rhizobacter sp.]|nr:YigZ family protein [Chlorobiales bacterium]